MSDGGVHISTDRPPTPDDADFVLRIDFLKHVANPQRVFQAADAMIRAFQRLDRVLCASIDSRIEPMMMLEEIEAGSIKIWLKNVLSAVDDDALKKLDWKQAVGSYLLKAKYAYISWTNKESSALTLADLSKEIKQIALETDVKHLPDYAPPSVIELAETTKQIEEAKSFLTAGDAISFGAPSDTPISFNLEVSWTTAELSEFSVKETTTFPNMRMNLIVRRPDYLGASKWEFRHGKKPIQAKIADVEWLKSFQVRRVDVRPGDALTCLVTIEYGYGYDNELIQENYTVTKVEKVLENLSSQASFLDKPPQ